MIQKQINPETNCDTFSIHYFSNNYINAYFVLTLLFRLFEPCIYLLIWSCIQVNSNKVGTVSAYTDVRHS